MTEENQDIVQDLRDWSYIVEMSRDKCAVTMLSGDIFDEAANEIERLRSSVVLCPECTKKEKDNG